MLSIANLIYIIKLYNYYIAYIYIAYSRKENPGDGRHWDEEEVPIPRLGRPFSEPT